MIILHSNSIAAKAASTNDNKEKLVLQSLEATSIQPAGGRHQLLVPVQAQQEKLV
jgi:hypothetical protein